MKSLTGFSTNSGSSWALAQLAYSQSFFNKAVPVNTSDVYPFMIDWMKSLSTFINDNYPTDDPSNIVNQNETTMIKLCKLIAPLNINPTLLDYENLCLLFTKIYFSWNDLIDQMFIYSSTIVYNDTTFHDRIMNETNRILIFQNTDLYTQMAVMPVSKITIPPTRPTSWLIQLLEFFRIGAETKSSTNVISYIGPANSNTAGFTVPIPCIYSVTSNGSKFVYAVPDKSMLPFKVYTSPAPNRFRLNDYTNFYLYNENANKGSILTELPSDAINNVMPFKDPFDGVKTTVTQVAAASSSSLSFLLTGFMPSFDAQYLSIDRYKILNNNNLTKHQKRIQLKTLAIRGNLIYPLDFFEKFPSL